MTKLNASTEKDQHPVHSSAPLSPRDIVNKQIALFHYHVTEEDLERMVISDQLIPYQSKKALDNTDTVVSQDLKSSYRSGEDL